MDMKERAEVIAKQEEAMRVSYFEEHITLKGKTPVCHKTQSIINDFFLLVRLVSFVL